MSATKTEKAPRIVVGVDGSASSLAALRWAVGQHCVHHARCPVVIVRGDLAQAA
jgi:nucleotide-binding universal stress UspA family protein